MIVNGTKSVRVHINPLDFLRVLENRIYPSTDINVLNPLVQDKELGKAMDAIDILNEYIKKRDIT